jgi:DNA-binding response OmpR family regulator
MQRLSVLIIEDEEGIRDGLEQILTPHFEVKTATNGIEGLKKSFKESPNLILLDLKMPEMDGFQVCKAIREDHDFDLVPIIILTAFNNVADRTKLFEMGADDYITKPFDPAELVARIQRALARVSPDVILQKTAATVPNSIRIGELVLDNQSQKVVVGKKTLPLSAIEFKLLYVLALNFDQIVEREKIVDYVWEKQNVSARLIDPHILAIREKLKGHHFSIQAIYGKGYILKNL